MTDIYFVRHAEPNYQNHDDAARELTAKGLEDRKLVTRFLSCRGIDAVLSSPYRRAVDTVKEFAEQQQLKIQIIQDFRERRVGEWIEDFEAFSRKQWEDFDYKLSDGESLREVQERNISALRQVAEQYRGKKIAVGSHGTALCTIIHYFDPSFGYTGFQRVRGLMPWIVKITFDNQMYVGREEYDLFRAGKNNPPVV